MNRSYGDSIRGRLERSRIRAGGGGAAAVSWILTRLHTRGCRRLRALTRLWQGRRASNRTFASKRRRCNHTCSLQSNRRIDNPKNTTATAPPLRLHLEELARIYNPRPISRLRYRSALRLRFFAYAGGLADPSIPGHGIWCQIGEVKGVVDVACYGLGWGCAAESGERGGG